MRKCRLPIVLCLGLARLLTFLPLGAQERVETDSVSARMIRQCQLYPQEVIHIQTDKQAYLSGERIWLRAHLVDALSGRPGTLSRYVYVELLNPFDEVLGRIQLRPDSVGVHAGYLDLDETLPEGTYTLRAYTRYMLNGGETSCFRKQVQVLDPYSLELETRARFSFDARAIRLDLRFADRRSGAETVPEAVTLSQRGGRSPALLKAHDGVFQMRFPAAMAGQTLLLGVSRQGRKYQRYLRMPWPDGEFDVALLPEGGYLVPGRACRVGVKAIRPDGLGVGVSGVVRDAQGQEVVRFGPLERGEGSFLLKAQPGASYTVDCVTQEGAAKTFALPPAEPSARTLQLIAAGGNLHVHLLQGEQAGPAGALSLLVHQRGIPLYHEALSADQTALSFPLAALPGGILHFLLLDGQERILSERLYFHLTEDLVLHPAVALSAERYAPRDLVEVTIPWTEGSGRIAVSVVDAEAAMPDRSQSLPATLLLQSELRGPIEEPAHYLTPEGAASLDALMLTQGWRRYDLPSVLQGRLAVPRIEPEQYQEITGEADAMLFSSVNGGRISLYATLDSLSSIETTDPDPSGRFRFRTEFPEGTTVTVQGQTRRGGNHVLLAIDPQTWPSGEGASLPTRTLPGATADPYMRQADDEYLLQHGERSTMLEAAVISAQQVEAGSDSPWYSPITASTPLTSAEIEKMHFTDITAVYLNTAGLALRGGSLVTTTRSDLPILPVIDNVVLPEYDLMTLSPEDIDNLFVIKDNTSMFGYYPGYSGALVITTSLGTGGSPSRSDHIARVKPLGYQRPAAFYAPKYDTPKRREEAPADWRTTLFWDPAVRLGPDAGTDSAGGGVGATAQMAGAQIRFFAADKRTSYLLTGEGVTQDGRLVYLQAEIPVE